MSKITWIAATLFMLSSTYGVQAQHYQPTRYVGYQQQGSGSKTINLTDIERPRVEAEAFGSDAQSKLQDAASDVQGAVTDAQDAVTEVQQDSDATSLELKEEEMPSVVQEMPEDETKMEMVESFDCDCEVVPEKKEEEPAEYSIKFKKGFLFEPDDKEKSPYTLRINGRMQFRYAGFSPDADTFTNLAGTTGIESQSGFEIERARLEFRGIFLDEDLSYYFNLDADTDDNHDVIFHDFWVDYRLSDMFNVRVGKAKVPASYEWFGSSTTTRFADRSVSTTLFRADRSTGVWFFGESEEDNFYWQTAIVNGFFATDLDQGDIDDVFSYAGLFYWDPFGDYGSGYSDIKRSENLKLRIGATAAYSNQNPFDDGSNTNEVGFARLSDGTQIATPGVLGPGLTVNNFDLYLVSIFASGKYRGFSWNSEAYARWIQDIETIEGPVPNDNKFFTSGFYTDVGYTLIDEKFEVIGRISNTDGIFGDSWEYAVGWNWFFNGTHKNKLTFDASVLDGIPVQSSSPNFIAGQNGTLYRLQYQAAF